MHCLQLAQVLTAAHCLVHLFDTGCFIYCFLSDHLYWICLLRVPTLIFDHYSIHSAPFYCFAEEWNPVGIVEIRALISILRTIPSGSLPHFFSIGLSSWRFVTRYMVHSSGFCSYAVRLSYIFFNPFLSFSQLTLSFSRYLVVLNYLRAT